MANTSGGKLSPTDIVSVFQESWDLTQQAERHSFWADLALDEAAGATSVPNLTDTAPNDIRRLSLPEHRARVQQVHQTIQALSSQVQDVYEGVRVTVSDEVGASIWPPMDLRDEPGEERLWITRRREPRPTRVTGYMTRLFLPGIIKPPRDYPNPSLFEEVPVSFRKHRSHEVPQNTIYLHRGRGRGLSRRERFEVTVLDRQGNQRVSIDFNT